ncbi:MULTISPECIES: TetR/AcrR family transcriptional regulator [Streptomyces]|uniref:TetR/AcrR family transcriptional regulator n=1 Tax=Streptomyces griseiscabiei TaxID=2993540 RepID=A0ABU4L8E9_9ACTN|nr:MULTISPECIES: TetR/AcrR family transcriptional regulator [Streptomyces]MDX2911318.1 TetR/AcrR family transcriptional regulator [Streptomyces griseiscabiei]
MSTPRKPRGPYRKGIERREQILRAALDVFSEHGERGASLKEIADRAGMSQAGVLHYFDSREELLLAVLAQRDALDAEASADVTSAGEAVARTAAHNTQQRGLVDLFVTLSAAASDPEHPAHAFFTRRYADLTEGIEDGLRTAQERGEIRTDVRSDQMARMLLALSDGLQLQWLLDPSVDMAETLEAFNRMCLGGTAERDGDAQQAAPGDPG